VGTYQVKNSRCLAIGADLLLPTRDQSIALRRPLGGIITFDQLDICQAYRALSQLYTFDDRDAVCNVVMVALEGGEKT